MNGAAFCRLWVSWLERASVEALSPTTGRVSHGCPGQQSIGSRQADQHHHQAAHQQVALQLVHVWTMET